MSVSATIRDVFDYFQNLNLLVLKQDLQDGRTTRHAWFSGSVLCPVAHGLPAGEQVRQLTALGQSADLDNGCSYAARHLGADPAAISRFVRAWDDGSLGQDWLFGQLEMLWTERRQDAELMQEIMQEPPTFSENAVRSESMMHVGPVSAVPLMATPEMCWDVAR